MNDDASDDHSDGIATHDNANFKKVKSLWVWSILKCFYIVTIVGNVKTVTVLAIELVPIDAIIIAIVIKTAVVILTVIVIEIVIVTAIAS